MRGGIQSLQAAVAGGLPVTLQNVRRGTYAAAATNHCASERVVLGRSGPFSTAHWWVLHPGPVRGTFLISSHPNQNCPRRWLGGSTHCRVTTVGLHARTNSHALLAWRLAPL